MRRRRVKYIPVLYRATDAAVGQVEPLRCLGVALGDGEGLLDVVGVAELCAASLPDASTVGGV